MAIEKDVIDHYSRGGLMDAIQQALLAAGKNLAALTPDDLGGIDEMHIGGRPATAHLLTYLQFRPHHHILDVGAGLGGAARLLASRTKARVSAIDLTPEYCSTAKTLTDLTGLGEHILYYDGSALSLPFEDLTFDGAYTIHTAMNIEDKARLYAEIHRVLQPGAYFGIYDVMAGPNTAPLTFPLPWASAAESSFLASPDEMRALLTDAAFNVITEDDLRGHALLVLKKMLDAAPGPLGPAIMLGDDYKVKVKNLLDAITAQKCAPRVMICQKQFIEEDGKRK